MIDGNLAMNRHFENMSEKDMQDMEAAYNKETSAPGEATGEVPADVPADVVGDTPEQAAAYYTKYGPKTRMITEAKYRGFLTGSHWQRIKMQQEITQLKDRQKNSDKDITILTDQLSKVQGERDELKKEFEYLDGAMEKGTGEINISNRSSFWLRVKELINKQ
jgi:hypothetical protein